MLQLSRDFWGFDGRLGKITPKIFCRRKQMHREVVGGNGRTIGAVVLSLMPAFCPKNCCRWLRPADFRGFDGRLGETTAQIFRRRYRVRRGLDDGDGRMRDASILLFPLVLCLKNVADCFGRWICGNLMAFRMNAPLELFAGGNRFMKMYIQW